MSTLITHLTAHPMAAEISQFYASGAEMPGIRSIKEKKRNGLNYSLQERVAD